MIRRRLFCMLIAALATTSVSAETWTYRGSLLDAGQPAQGQYDFRIALYTEPLSGKLAMPAQTLSGLDVKDGHFNAELDLDAKLLAYPELWLAVEVGDGGGGFVALDARTRIVPKAVQATGCWDLQGNTGTDAGNFLGTTDNIAVRFRVGNRAAFSITPYPFAGGQPQLVSPGTVINTNNAGIVAFGGGSDPGVGHVATGVYASIGGGATNEASGNYAHVGGGSANKSLSTSSTVAGGYGNTAGSATPGFGTYATVAGGESNSASGGWAVVGGGELNTASGGGTFVGGGAANFATGNYAAVPGGTNNSAGDYSFAAGSYAKAVTSGSFVWADASTLGDFTASGPNQFLVQAAGGVGINTTVIGSADDLVLGARSAVNGGDADADLVMRTRAGKVFRAWVRESDGAVVLNPASASGDTKFILGAGGAVPLRYLITQTGAYLSTVGIWTDVSSRALKTDFKTINTQSMLDKVLALPVTEWSYRADLGSRHLGPVAEDFHASFGLGESDAHIASLDSVGVALAAIQGLNAKLESENAKLRTELDALQAAVAKLQAR